MRIGRDASDKRMPDADQWRRYRCNAEACGWVGLLPVARRRRDSLDAVQTAPRAVRLGVSALALMVIAGLMWGGVQVLQQMLGS